MEDRIKDVLDYIEENLGNRLMLVDLAAMACLSPSQFHRQFKKQTGRTPFKFIEELKMNKANHLILQEKWMIQELSEEFGYRDYETFSRAFKKYFHLSPDDLKAIVHGVHSNVKDQSHELMILALDDSVVENDLMSHLKAFMEDRELKLEDLKEAQIFKIVTKELADESKTHLIKNKFAMAKDDKLWQSLIKERK